MIRKQISALLVSFLHPDLFGSYVLAAVFTSDHPKWFKSRLHWSLAGAYIDPPEK
jgi:hypothetical protein